MTGFGYLTKIILVDKSDYLEYFGITEEELNDWIEYPDNIDKEQMATFAYKINLKDVNNVRNDALCRVIDTKEEHIGRDTEFLSEYEKDCIASKAVCFSSQYSMFVQVKTIPKGIKYFNRNRYRITYYKKPILSLSDDEEVKCLTELRCFTRPRDLREHCKMTLKNFEGTRYEIEELPMEEID